MSESNTSLVKKAQKVLKTLAGYAKSERGNISMMAGLSIIPLLVSGGAAIDYERGVNAGTILQASLDSAALYAANLPDTSNAALKSKSQIYMQQNYKYNSDAVLSNFNITNNGSSVTATAQATLKNNFMSLVGIPTTTIAGSSTAQKGGGTKLEVSMVLDNTGSMGQFGKIGAEITASTNLLNQLKALVVNPTDIFVSIIPFDVTVNVGTGNAAANWVTWNDFGTCNNGAGSPNTKAQCNNRGGGWTLSTIAQRASWNGCVTDRGAPLSVSAANYDVNVVPPITTDTTSMYPAIKSSCPQQAMGLSNNWSGMQTVINNMVPGANTNQNLGLQMGWMSMTGGGPFTIPTLAPNATYKQAMVLLTDGLNTADRWFPNQTQIDARQTLACTAMKAAGVIFYAVQIDIGGNDGVSPLLQSCVTDPAKFFYLTSANQAITAFNSIGNDLANIYLSK